MCVFLQLQTLDSFVLNSGKILLFYIPCYHISMQTVFNLLVYLLFCGTKVPNSVSYTDLISQHLYAVQELGKLSIIHKYTSQIQHGLSFVFLPQVFGGDDDNKGKTSSSNYPVSVLLTQSCPQWETVELPC